MYQTKKPAAVLIALMQDCITYRLTDAEGIQYINERLKKIHAANPNTKEFISDSSYDRLKAFCNSDHTVDLFFDYHTRVGFMVNHKNHIAEIENLQKECWRAFIKEIARPESNSHAIARIADTIRRNNERLASLDLANPVLAKIKMRLDIENNPGPSSGNQPAGTTDQLPQLTNQRKF